MEERRKRVDNSPQNALFELYLATAYRVHPYGKPVLGTMADIKSIQRDDLYRHYKQHYSPDNAFIVIAGDVDTDDIIKKIDKSFGPLRRANAPQQRIPKEPPQHHERRAVLKRQAEVPHIIMGYHVPSIPHPDSYPLQVLSTILSGGRSSRLHSLLVRQTRLATTTGSQYNATAIDPTMLDIWATATLNASIYDIERETYAELERLKKTPPTKRELQSSKNQITASFVFDQDSIDAQAAKIAAFETAGSWRLMDAYIDKIAAVTARDITRVARKYLTKANRTVAILSPITTEHQQCSTQDANQHPCP